MSTEKTGEIPKSSRKATQEHSCISASRHYVNEFIWSASSSSGTSETNSKQKETQAVVEEEGSTDKAESIREYIYSLLREGHGKCDHLISERGIAEQFSIPRRTAREALLSLESQGLLKCEPQRGYRLVSFDHTSLPMLRRFRYFVEREAGMLAVQNITRQELAELMVICDDMEMANQKKDMHEMAELDLLFHRTMVLASHDNMVINVYNILTIPIFPLPKTTDMQSTLNGHREMVNALRTKDAKTLNRLLTEHMGTASGLIPDFHQEPVQTQP